jgi:CheY-like chemotaxis protein
MRLGRPKDHRVRFVFGDAVVSLALAADATFADIAAAWAAAARRHRGKPVAIDVTVPALRGPDTHDPEIRRERPGRWPVRWISSKSIYPDRPPATLDGDRAPRAGSILVVDDDPDVRDVAVGILADAGFTVLAASCGTDAFCLLEQHPDVSLLFTDIVMPGLDGLMLADMAIIHRRDIRVVYATGYSDHMRREPGYRYGPVLEKPYRAAELIRLIEHELARPGGLWRVPVR